MAKPIQAYLARKTTAKHAPRDTHAQCSVRPPLAQNRAKSRSAERGAGGVSAWATGPDRRHLMISSRTELRTWRSHRASRKKSNGWARRLCSLTLAYLECISVPGVYLECTWSVSPWLVNNSEEGNARGIPAEVCRISQLK